MGMSELSDTCSSARDSEMFLERPSDLISRLRVAATSAVFILLWFLK